MKEITTKMRRGEYHFDCDKDSYPPHFDSSPEYDFQGVRLESYENANNDYEAFTPNHITLRPHWDEFVDALDDFDLILDVMPDDAEPCFQISNIELPVNIFKVITKSLEGKSFRHYKFINNDFGRYGVLAVIDLLDSNRHLQSLTLSKNSIDEEDESDLCDAITRHPALSTIRLDDCWEERMFIVCELLRSNQLVEISMRYNDLSFGSSDERQSFTDALVSNRSLEKLDLTGICLNDEGLGCFATVLDGNSTLNCLCLEGDHHFTNAAVAIFGEALRTNTTLQILSGIEGCYDALSCEISQLVKTL
jgi:Ran GTPase-activating protein (RanGAP) involved in mRNA processing and transport